MTMPVSQPPVNDQSPVRTSPAADASTVLAATTQYFQTLILNASETGRPTQSGEVTKQSEKLECGPMPNVMVSLPMIGGTLCSTPQSLADAEY